MTLYLDCESSFKSHRTVEIPINSSMSCGGLDQRAGAHDIEGKAEGNGLIWPGKDKDLGGPHCCLLGQLQLISVRGTMGVRCWGCAGPGCRGGCCGNGFFAWCSDAEESLPEQKTGHLCWLNREGLFLVAPAGKGVYPPANKLINCWIKFWYSFWVTIGVNPFSPLLPFSLRCCWRTGGWVSTTRDPPSSSVFWHTLLLTPCPSPD